MEDMRIKTKKMLDGVENAPNGSFLESVRRFVGFAEQQSQSFDEVLAQKRELLQQVESAWGIDFEKVLKQFVAFAQGQPESFDDILVGELEAQYQAFKSGGGFTGAAEYALI